MQNYLPNNRISYNKGNGNPSPQQYNSASGVQAQSSPSYAGVNIQIFNPMVNPNGGFVYPQQTSSAFSAGTQGGCYPASYYTMQPGICGYNNYPQAISQNNQNYNGQSGFYDQFGKYHPYVQNQNGQIGYLDDNGNFQPLPINGQNGGVKDTNGQSGFYDKDGKYHQYAKGPNGELGYYDEQGKFHPVDPNNPPTNGVKDTNGQNGFYDKDGKYHQYAKGPNGELGYYDEQGKFHPVDPNNPQGPANNKETEKNTENITSTEKTSEQSGSDGAKTEKKKVVMLSNDYIKSIENYLNSQDLEVRKMGAHEVVDRLAEDSSRNDDPALTALVNKMLQDPSASIRAIALSLVESRAILGDNLTEKILKNMQKTDKALGLDANQATSALLKMAQKTVEKEVPVSETKNTLSQKSSRPKTPYFFNSDKEKYQWLIKNGCNSDSEKKWLEDYIKQVAEADKS